jgi:hypothetical protein
MEINKEMGQAKIGLWIMTTSTLAISMFLIFNTELHKGALIMLGGAGTVGLVMTFESLTKHKYKFDWHHVIFGLIFILVGLDNYQKGYFEPKNAGYIDGPLAKFISTSVIIGGFLIILLGGKRNES